MECDIRWWLVSKRIQNLTSTHTHGRTHTHGQTHTHTHTDTWISNAYACTHGQTHTQAHTDTHHDMYTYTQQACTSHTYTHTHTQTHRACKSDNFEKSLIFLHTASILVSIQQRRKSRVWPTLRWRNSVTVGKMALTFLPCYFQKSCIYLCKISCICIIYLHEISCVYEIYSHKILCVCVFYLHKILCVYVTDMLGMSQVLEKYKN